MSKLSGILLTDVRVLICIIALLTIGRMAYAYDYNPQPEKAALMVIHAHPDDEGIFFGGTLPYYTQVKKVPTVLINMTTGWLYSDGSQTSDSITRESELRTVAWRYGLRNEPIFAFFQQTKSSVTIDESWDRWANHITDGDDIAEGQQRASRYFAEQIRLYKPDVIVTHDFGGEYGHPDHRNLPTAIAAAWDLAAGREATIPEMTETYYGNTVTVPGQTISPDGIAGTPWQVKKLYIHNYDQNQLFHDFWEDISVDDPGNGTPRQIANYAMQAYPSQGKPHVASVYAPLANGNNAWDDYPSELWGLYATTVGPDTVADDFTIEGTTYSGWARGDFFAHIHIGEVIQPKAVVSEEYVFNSAVNTINNHRLSQAVNDGGAVASALSAIHGYGGIYNGSYASTAPGGRDADFFEYIGNDTDVDIVYDLSGGGDLDIGSVIFWQYENSGSGDGTEVGNHARTIEIRINTEAQGDADFLGAATTVTLLPVVDGDTDPDNDMGGVNSAQFFALDSLDHGRYVQLSITDNYYGLQGMTGGGDRVGLGEVRFAALQSYCVNPPAGDMNGDCVQDLSDLAIWELTYQDCGIVPASACP